MNIDVSYRGGVILGNSVICDGFAESIPFRVQTHAHEDHLRDFSKSVGLQNIVLTKPTRDLISIIKNNESLYDRNGQVNILGGNSKKNFADFKIKFLDSKHMLGSIQVEVEYKNGLKVGYSSDFIWPLGRIIEVDELVIDSTYGNPDSVRTLDQDKAIESFINLIIEHIYNNPIIINAKRGIIIRAMKSVNSAFPDIPLLTSKKLYSEVQVYNRHGYSIDNISVYNNPASLDVLNSNRYVVFLSSVYDIFPVDTSDHTSITIKATYGRKQVITNHGNNFYTFALSDHADFEETLEYVKFTKAKTILTDSTRAGIDRALKLANEIKRKLGINSSPANPVKNNSWGGI